MVGLNLNTRARVFASFVKGDAIHQRPLIAHREIECSSDFEVLEIVAPADFKTRIVNAPEGYEGVTE